MSGAEGAVDSFRRAGVTRVFGAPAVETTPLFDAFRESSIEIVLVTHARSAAFMADAHARVTGELSVCLLCPGPGLINVLGGIGEARLDSSPMVVLVAGSGLAGAAEPGSGLQALDHSVLTRPMCKGIFTVDEPEMVPHVLSQAIAHVRRGEPGPVLVEIPAEVQQREGRMEGTGFRPVPKVISDEAVAGLELVAQKIKAAKTVGIYAGAGCLVGMAELAELADRLDAPVATTISGLGVLPYIHPLCVGFGPGASGTPLAETTVGRCDLVLAIGCKFYDSTVDGAEVAPRGELVHVDIDPGVAGRNTDAAVAITAPAKAAMRFLLDRVDEKNNAEIREHIRQGKRSLRKAIGEREAWTDAVDPVKFFVQLRDQMGGEDVLVLDAGRHAYFGIASYQVQAPRTLLAPTDYGALGFAVPCAVAAKLAIPEHTVVACVGDGGFLLTGMELLTARRCNVAPVVVVFAEAPLESHLSSPERMLRRDASVELVPVNYEDLARALDVHYVRIMRDADIAPGLSRALTAQAPVVVEMRVAYRDAAYYLKAAQRSDWQHKPRPVALRLGARVIMSRILAIQ
jgi:acetolactate synthase-1/2/3 large subunit